MTDDKFSPEQSLQFIQSMINKTRQDMSHDSIYFIIWGWLTFIAFTAQFILKHILEYEQHYQVWWITVVGIVLSIRAGRKEKRQQKVTTYIGESMKYLWMGIGISFFVLSIIFSRIGWGASIYPFFILLYGLGTFISGNILRFRPLAIGGVIAWLLAIGSAYVTYDYQMLFGAGAILCSYIIPAYLLRFKKESINN
jgi:hypothetical protein